MHLFQLTSGISIYKAQTGIFHFKLLIEWKQILRYSQKIWAAGFMGLTEAIMLMMCDSDLSVYTVVGRGQIQEYETREWKV